MPKLATVRIDAEIKSILARGSFDALNYFLPDQLDRATYTKANKVLASLGAKWHRGQKAHVFPTKESIVEFRAALEDGVLIDRKKTFGQFDTPPSLAERLVDLAEVRDGHSFLEPSAGIGRIAGQVWNRHGLSVAGTLIEIDQERHDRLCDHFHGGQWVAILADFLEWEFDQTFDRIIANPPFANGEDAKHVMKMLDLLTPGGRLVTVMAASIGFRDNGPYRKLKDRLDSFTHEIIDLPSNSFRESGTNVNTCILIVEG